MSHTFFSQVRSIIIEQSYFSTTSRVNLLMTEKLKRVIKVPVYILSLVFLWPINRNNQYLHRTWLSLSGDHCCKQRPSTPMLLKIKRCRQTTEFEAKIILNEFGELHPLYTVKFKEQENVVGTVNIEAKVFDVRRTESCIRCRFGQNISWKWCVGVGIQLGCSLCSVVLEIPQIVIHQDWV